MTTATTPRQPAKRAKGRALKHMIKLLKKCREHRGPACSENGILGFSNREIEQSIGIAAPRKERKQP